MQSSKKAKGLTARQNKNLRGIMKLRRTYMQITKTSGPNSKSKKMQTHATVDVERDPDAIKRNP